VGKVAIAVREERNTNDRYAVAILEEDTSCMCGTFTARNFQRVLLLLRWVERSKLNLLGRADRVAYLRAGLRSHAF